jgi:hypothetical protein
MIKLLIDITVIFARYLRYIGFISYLSGALLVMFGMHLKIPDSFEMPLGRLKGISVDTQGNIYCGSQFYERIQVYNPKGQFLYGISIDTSGLFWIRINSDDYLEVAVAIGKKKYIFNKNGEQISLNINTPNYLEGFDTKREHYCYDSKRDIMYRIRPILSMPFLGSNVIKKDASGKETVIIGTPISKWLFMGPFPAFFFVILSVIISVIFDQNFREKMLKALRGEAVPKFLLLQSKKSNNK